MSRTIYDSDWGYDSGKWLKNYSIYDGESPCVTFVSEAADQTFAGTLRGTSGKSITINWGDGNSENLAFSGGDQAISHDYGQNGTFTIALSGDIQNLTKINYISQKLGLFHVPSTLTSLTYFRLEATSVSGDIANLGTLTNLTYLNLGATSVSGDIANLGTLTSLTTLSLPSTSVSGDIANLGTLTSLTTLSLYNTSVSGDIANLGTLTSLTTLSLASTSISGDIANLGTLTSLTTLYLYNTSCSDFTSAALPASWVKIWVYSVGLDSTEVDNFLIRVDGAGGTNGTLKIAGTNAARTAASDAAKASLVGKGWTIEVNE